MEIDVRKGGWVIRWDSLDVESVKHSKPPILVKDPDLVVILVSVLNIYLYPQSSHLIAAFSLTNHGLHSPFQIPGFQECSFIPVPIT